MNHDAKARAEDLRQSSVSSFINNTGQLEAQSAPKQM
jgi:hypothetical protein